MPPKYEVRCLIETKEHTKSFGKENEIVAVDSLTLQVDAGEVFGFVGPNGAGKTTTMKMLIGLLEPSSHSMTEVEEICDRIGVISKGRLIAVGTVEELRDKVMEREGVRYLLEVSGLAAEEVALALEQIGSVHSVEVSDGGIRLLVDKGARMEIAEVVKRSGGAVSRFEEERMDLQRVFLRLIGV